MRLPCAFFLVLQGVVGGTNSTRSTTRISLNLPPLFFLVLQGAVEQKETQLWALVAELKEAQVRDTPTTLQHTNRRRRR
jgi:hypothetical protein